MTKSEKIITFKLCPNFNVIITKNNFRIKSRKQDSFCLLPYYSKIKRILSIHNFIGCISERIWKNSLRILRKRWVAWKFKSFIIKVNYFEFEVLVCQWSEDELSIFDDKIFRLQVGCFFSSITKIKDDVCIIFRWLYYSILRKTRCKQDKSKE